MSRNILMFLFFTIIAEIFLSCKNGIEIPFELKEGRIVLSANVNGTKGKFYWDTGTNISSVNTRVDNLRFAGTVIHTILGATEELDRYALNGISIGNVKLDTKSEVVHITEDLQQMILDQEGLDGILGITIFEGYWCEVSFSKKKIILYKEKPARFTQSAPVEIIDANFFCIPGMVDETPIYFSIDTGASQAMLFPESIARQKQAARTASTLSGDDYTTVLSNGLIKKYHMLKTHSISVLDETFVNKFILSNSHVSQNNGGKYDNIGVLGINFLSNYDLLFDFTELRSFKSSSFYYEPYIPPEERRYGFYSYFDQPPPAGILGMHIDPEQGVVIDEVFESGIAYQLGLRPDMIITKINGASISDMGFEQLTDPHLLDTISELTVIIGDVERTIQRGSDNL